MKESANLQEFCDFGNLVDVEKIIRSKFSNLIVNLDIQDVIQDFLFRCAKNKTIERFDSNKGAVFSTYMFTCIRNHMLAYNSNASRKYVFWTTMCSLDTGPHSETYYKPLDREIVRHSDEDDFMSKEFDQEAIYLSLKKMKFPKRKDKNLPPHELYLRYINGHRDGEIAEETGYTVAGIGAKKRKLIKLLKVYYESVSQIGPVQHT